MRRLAIDFNFTVLGPLLIWVAITLWNSIQTYRWPTEKLLERQPSLEDAESHAHWQWERRKERRNSVNLIWISAVAIVLLGGLFLLSDKWKVHLAFQVWQLLEVVSAISLFIVTVMAWHYARRQERLRLIFCLLGMLFTAASTEHFFHQSMNTGHIVCPHCSDEDQPDDEP